MSVPSSSHLRRHRHKCIVSDGCAAKKGLTESLAKAGGTQLSQLTESAAQWHPRDGRGWTGDRRRKWRGICAAGRRKCPPAPDCCTWPPQGVPRETAKAAGRKWEEEREEKWEISHLGPDLMRPFVGQGSAHVGVLSDHQRTQFLVRFIVVEDAHATVDGSLPGR